VRWFRRREETLNEQLLREAGLDTPENVGEAAEADAEIGGEETEAAPGPTSPGPADPAARPLLTRQWQERPPEWDTFVTAEAPGLHGDRFEFAAVPDGSLIVDASVDDDLSPLADAVERELQPPYRAVAVRQGRTLWSLSARRIDVAEARCDKGDKLETPRRRPLGGHRRGAVAPAR
jgi:hypothetical protein